MTLKFTFHSNFDITYFVGDNDKPANMGIFFYCTNIFDTTIVFIHMLHCICIVSKCIPPSNVISSSCASHFFRHFPLNIDKEKIDIVYPSVAVGMGGWQ